MPKISIIMPVYNKQDYLKRSLDSVLNQDFSDYELITVDDGSGDKSLEILKEYEARDSRVKVLHTGNHGVSHARNVGLKNAEGEYLTFVDADDEIKQGYLSSLHRTLMENSADIVIQGLTNVYPDGQTKEVFAGASEGSHDMMDIISDFAEIQKDSGIFGYCVSKLFSRNLCDETVFDEDLKLAEDFDFYLKIYRRTKTLYFDRSSNYLYYQGLTGSSVDIRDEEIDYRSQLLINLRYKEFLEEMHAYSGKNKEIVDQLICSNAYHMLFYADEDRFAEMCALVRKKIPTDVLRKGSGFQSGVLRNVLKGEDAKCSLMIRGYKAARRMKRLFK